MDCNKDEAIRAKEVSEKKMENNDFEGARKIALKAQNLYPELENIAQLLSVCDVHCSAQKKIAGSEKDWYGILQVERLADETTIKKQYRRLALILHPDKNKFPGAEAAFKLISEANAVLSDVGRKSIYDTKIRVSVRPNPLNRPPHMNTKYNFNQQFSAQNNVANGFHNLNQHQATGATFAARKEVFWTSCPFCMIQYQFPREFVNKSLQCRSCLKPYIAFEIISQGAPLGSSQPGVSVPSKAGWSRPAVFHEKVVLNQGNFKMGVQNGKGSTASDVGTQGLRREPGTQMGSNSEGIKFRDLIGNQRDRKNGTSRKRNGKSGVASTKESIDLKNKSKKRDREFIVDSSNSFDSSSDSDSDDEDETIQESRGDPFNNLNSGSGRAHIQRRSSRIQQNVSYKEIDGDEDDEDDDFAGLTKRKKSSENYEDNRKEQRDALNGENSKQQNESSFPVDANNVNSESKQKGAVHPDKILRNKDVKCDKECQVGETGTTGNGAKKLEIESESDLDSYSMDDSDKKRYECPDAEFYDFEKERDARRFNTEQIWACYDDVDGMPRFYAKIKKASAFPFEVNLRWLDPVPVDARENCVTDEFPTSCGTYKLGKTGKTSVLVSFSHEMMPYEQYKKRGSVLIYPRQGEVWALYKDWHMGPENNQVFKYAIVEVLSDFVSGDGIKVCYLDKVVGFVSLFHRASQSESGSFFIRTKELYKFSHRIPSCKMTGSEREGVPKGSFELDPASLPMDPNDLYFPLKAKTESENLDHEVHCSPTATGKKNKSIPNDFVDLDD